MQATNTRPRFEVAADAHGSCSHAGVVLLAELADRLGLTSELGCRANLGLARRGGSHAHDRGAVLRDLVVMLADGGDCVSDLAGLREQAGLFGAVCSTPTAWRVVHEIAADPRGVAGLWSALARVRQRAWAAGAAPKGLLRIDLDATLLDAHSDKQGAAGTFKHGFGFHPLGAWLDRGDGTGEALSGILRPGNAGSNTAQDHIDVLAMALLALPKAARDRPILVRAGTAGATHAFVDDIVARKLWFSIGFPLEPDVQAAILQIPAPTDSGDNGGWTPATDPGGRARPGAWVAELSGLDLASQGWPAGTRAICRRERPHPGAAHKIAFTDHTGHRFQVFITNQPDPDPARLEARHRPHARVEDRIRCGKASGLRNLPFGDFDANDAWLTLVAIAQTLVCWAQALLLDGDLKVAEPKTLRFRLWHAAARLVRHARRHVLRFDRDWPWASALVAAFGRLPVPG
ncbi:MAG TPA: IS1380 family transposase [Actinomycetes bacterium]|nr:IS1380 family transposase [Actinomycetes bacterium]